MKNEVCITIKMRENCVIVRNDRGMEWQYGYNGCGTGKDAAATVAVAMLWATARNYLERPDVNGDEWRFTLTYETPGAADC